MISDSHVCKLGGLVALACAFAAPSAHAQLADLSVRIQAPSEALAGTDIGPRLKIVVANTGTGTARGTDSAGSKGYMVDIFLTRTTMPDGFARYAEQYHDGVLLRGGRVGNTVSLTPGTRRSYGSGGTLPANTPAGIYRLCASVDPGKAVAESNEGNNISCTTLKVTRLQVMPTPHLSVVDGQPPAPGTQRTVLADGTLQIRYPDGTLRQRRPDGKVVTIDPQGRATIPFAMSVQPADLPPLPGGLADWGSGLGTQLLGILRNILSDPEYEAYLQTEQGKSFYELIRWRLDSIGFLTAAP